MTDRQILDDACGEICKALDHIAELKQQESAYNELLGIARGNYADVCSFVNRMNRVYRMGIIK